MKEVIVISGKGGTGKTSVTAALASLWQPLVIADCDVDAPDLHLLLSPEVKRTEEFYSGVEPEIDNNLCTRCGVCRTHCAFDALDEQCRIDRAACEGCGVCTLVCPEKAVTLHERHCGQWFESETRFGPMIHALLGTGEENSGKLVTYIKQAARKKATEFNYGFLLSDGSPGTGCPVISSLSGASLAVIVTEPTLSAMHDLKRVLGTAKHFNIPAGIIINKYDINEEIAGDIEKDAEKNDTPVFGRIEYNTEFVSAMVQGKCITEWTARGALNASIRQIAGAVMNYLNGFK